MVEAKLSRNGNWHDTVKRWQEWCGMQMEVDSIRILVEVGRWVAQDAGLSKLSAVVTARCINLGSDQDMYTHYPQLVKQKQKRNTKTEKLTKQK